MSRLVLFDIDGTLVHAGPYASRAYPLAFGEVFGITPPIHTIRLGGKTDRAILLEVLGLQGLSREEVLPHLARVHHLYHGLLERELGGGEEVRLLPGVRPLLGRLAAAGATLGLVTGNTEGGARLKLAPLGLNRFFPFGAYGDESEARSDLVDLALARAHARVVPRRFAGKEVVVVGDSVNDVACGRHLGVMAVAVATGWTASGELAAAGADVVLDSLAEVDRAVQAILGG